jgi:hypothetical protein
MRALLGSFRKADFFSLENKYNIFVTDLQTNILGIRIGSRVKTVEDHGGEYDGMPHSVTELERQIQAIVDSVRSSSLAHPK